jgi:uncharacterized membrane protein
MPAGNHNKLELNVPTAINKAMMVSRYVLLIITPPIPSLYNKKPDPLQNRIWLIHKEIDIVTLLPYAGIIQIRYLELENFFAFSSQPMLMGTPSSFIVITVLYQNIL